MLNEYLKEFNSKLKKGPTFLRHVGEISDKVLGNEYVSGYIDCLDRNKYQIALSGAYYALLTGAEIAFGQVFNHPYVGALLKNEHRIPVGTTLFPPHVNVGSGPQNTNFTRPLAPPEIGFVEVYENPLSHIAAAAVPPGLKAAKKGVDYSKK